MDICFLIDSRYYHEQPAGRFSVYDFGSDYYIIRNFNAPGYWHLNAGAELFTSVDDMVQRIMMYYDAGKYTSIAHLVIGDRIKQCTSNVGYDSLCNRMAKWPTDDTYRHYPELRKVFADAKVLASIDGVKNQSKDIDFCRENKLKGYLM